MSLSHLPEPFLGRMVIELVEIDVEDYMKKKAGLAADSKLVIPEAFKEKHRVPFKKGRIVKLAPDAFGDAFKQRYGRDHEYPHIDDIVLFVPNESYAIDMDNKYHIIADQDIVGFYKHKEAHKDE